jgi:hypothetical protein
VDKGPHPPEKDTKNKSERNTTASLGLGEMVMKISAILRLFTAARKF